jgi:chaperonin GroEL
MQNYQIDLKNKGVDIHHGADARRRLLKGAALLAKCVGVTYGPGGRIVMLDRPHGLLATKDGVTVAREVEVEDPVANLGCLILKEACVKVNDDVGDGTTSTAIIAEAILREGQKVIAAGMSPIPVSRGVQAAAKTCTEVIQSLAIPVEVQAALERVAMIASNGDEEVSKKMAEAVMAVGKDGTLTIEDGNTVGIELEFKDGMEIDRGAASPHLLKGATERVIEGPLVAVIGKDLRTVEDIKDLMEVASQWPDHELLIIAQSIEGNALKTVVMNNEADVVRVVAVNSPGFHEKKKDILKDIAALTGADYIDPDLGHDLGAWDAEWFGGLRKATIRAKSAVFLAYDEAEELIEARIKEIKAGKRFAKSEYDTDKINERIARLSGGLCIMKVGGYTESEMKERRARIEDALGSVRAALRTGIVPGAGSTYMACSHQLAQVDVSEEDMDFQAGWNILTRALQRPLQVLAANAGHRSEYMADRLLDHFTETGDYWMGWDAVTGSLRNLNEGDEAIIDPQAVAHSVIEAAVSTAGTLLTVEASLSKAAG